MKQDKFLGRWLVTEYVFNPNGRYIGQIQQKRELHELTSGRIQVTQQCHPEDALANHPMGKFAGTWVFELSRHGRSRHYHGPDVIGAGVTWQDGVMTGHGVWPQFGYSFHSYGILVSPNRQLTGGQFFLPGENVAQIIGIAVPEEGDEGYPQLDFDQFVLPNRSNQYTGQINHLSADGDLRQTDQFTRRVTKTGDQFIWHDQIDDQPNKQIIFQPHPSHNCWQVKQGNRHGFARRFGPAIIINLVENTGQHQTNFDIYDKTSDVWASLKFHYVQGKHQTTDFIRLTSAKT